VLGVWSAEWEMAYHPDICPVMCSRFGVVVSSALGAMGALRAASADTLTMRTRDLEGLAAAVDLRRGRRRWTRKKGAR